MKRDGKEPADEEDSTRQAVLVTVSRALLVSRHQMQANAGTPSSGIPDSGCISRSPVITKNDTWRPRGWICMGQRTNRGLTTAATTRLIRRETEREGTPAEASNHRAWWRGGIPRLPSAGGFACARDFTGEIRIFAPSPSMQFCLSNSVDRHLA